MKLKWCILKNQEVEAGQLGIVANWSYKKEKKLLDKEKIYRVKGWKKVVRSRWAPERVTVKKRGQVYFKEERGQSSSLQKWNFLKDKPWELKCDVVTVDRDLGSKHRSAKSWSLQLNFEKDTKIWASVSCIKQTSNNTYTSDFGSDEIR